MSNTRVINVCARLREERSRLGLSQQEVADLSEVHLKTAQRWELGVAIPGDALGVLGENGFDVQYICTGARSGGLAGSDPDAALVSARFRSERLRLDIVHSELVRQTGYDKKHVLDWERGGVIPASALKALGLIGFDLEYLATGVRGSGDSSPALTPFEWKLIKKVRALGDLHQKQVLALIEVISAGIPLGGNTVVMTGDNKRAAGRDYNDNRDTKSKPSKGKK